MRGLLSLVVVRDYILSEQTRTSARFLPGLITSPHPHTPRDQCLTRSKAEKSRLSRCYNFHKVLGSNGDRDKRYQVLTMDDGGCCPVRRWNPGGLLPYLPQLTKPSQAVGQTPPIFGRNVCNKERGQMEHPSTRHLIFSSDRPRERSEHLTFPVVEQ